MRSLSDPSPGESAREHLIVTNHSASRVDFRLSAADGLFTENGRFNMLPSGQESTGAGTWIDLPDAVSLEPGESEVVAFTVTVPENATPGDHPAGIAASHMVADDGDVGLESRVGFRVMTRVTGTLEPAVSGSISGKYAGELNPFDPGEIRLSYEITNTGNTRLEVDPRARVAGPLGLGEQVLAAEQVVEMAPGETREGEMIVRAAWPLFTYTAELDLVAREILDGDAALGRVQVQASTSLWAAPWSQAATGVIGALIVVWWSRERRARTARVGQLIEQARADGIAVATATSGQTS